MAIIVAHPDTQHSVHAARGLRRAGLLEYLFTSFSLRRPALLAPALKALTPRYHLRLAQHRGHQDFASDELRVFPAHLAATRLGPRWATWTRRAFARAAARMAIRRQAGVMAFNSNATETFRLLEGRGLPCILDQSIAHRRWREQVVAEEAATFPSWERERLNAGPLSRVLAEEDEEVARAELILCGSEFCAQTMIEQGVDRRKVAVAEYGADTEKFTPAPRPRDPRDGVRLLFVGALVLRKGVPYLLEAVKRVSGLGVKVTMAGIVNVRREALAPYEDVATIRGAILHGEMPELFRAHDIYVFPSLVEGSSLAIYEALASGLPVITTPNSGSIVRHGIEGLIVPPRDVDALAAAIETLARDPALRESMGKAARARALEFGSWQKYGERLASAILAKWPTLARVSGEVAAR